MDEILERFLDCVREYFLVVTITNVENTSITFHVTDTDEDYITASLQSICEDLCAEYEIETELNPLGYQSYTFSYSDILEE